MTSVLILAGRRNGTTDPLAEEAGVSHKCLVPIGGKPLVMHPVEAALDLPGLTQVLISSDDVEGLRTVHAIRHAEEQGRVRLLHARTTLTGSVMAAGAVARFPMVVTTADNVLLTRDALVAFCAASEATGGSATMALARREAVLAAHPQGQRRFYRFADGAFSNCNLYWIRTPEALAAAQAFSGGGQFAKHPMRMARAFGIINLILFRLGRLKLETMMGRLSRVFGVSVRPVEMVDGSLAIDVDNARTYGIAEGLLAARATAAEQSEKRLNSAA